MGERLTSVDQHQSLNDYVIYCIHVATYEFARRYVVGKRVLDFGCGVGYGTEELASDATTIVGVDISAEAIETARSRVAPNLSFRQIRPVENAPLPFADNSFDVVLSFQVIEHVADVDSYLTEARRVLAPGGTFICATPDRRTRLYPRQRPWNEYHLREYGPEIAEVLQPHFADVELFGVQAADDVLAAEYRRCARLRRLTLPFTFPAAPEAWRRMGLRTLKRLQPSSKWPALPTDAFPYDHSVISITPGVAQPGPDLVAVSRS